MHEGRFLGSMFLRIAEERNFQNGIMSNTDQSILLCLSNDFWNPNWMIITKVLNYVL